jgi:hypothetical protein
MAKNHRNAPKVKHTAIPQKDLLFNAAMNANAPTTKHQTGIGSHILSLLAHQAVLSIDRDFTI